MGEGNGAGGQGQSGDAGDGNPTQIQITVGDETKIMSAEEVVLAVSKAGELDVTNEQFAGFKKVLTQYGINPEEYLRNSEASFALMNQLIEQGVIDEQGNVVEKKIGDVLPKVPPVVPDEGKVTKSQQVVLDTLTKIGERMVKLEDGQSNIHRRNISRDVKAVYPNLTDDDVSKSLAKAQADRSVNFWDHVKVVSEEKTTKESQVALTHAKDTIKLLVKVGALEEGKVDLEKLDLAALEKFDPKTEPPVYEGKKFMFGSRQRKLGKTGDPEYTLPGDSMKEMLDKRKE
jgi:hypothetical protein